MQLALSGFLFEKGYREQSISFEQFCETASRQGYQGVELRRTQVSLDTTKEERKELIDIVQQHNLCVTCLTTRGMPDAGEERNDFFLSYLDLCSDMECGLLKTSGEPEWCRWAAEKAASCKITLACNNHAGTPLATIAGTRKFFADVAHPNFKLLYDPMHLRNAGEDYLACIEEFAPITANILIQSSAPNPEGQRVPLLPGDPKAQNWAEIVRLFLSFGYTGLATIIENGWPPEQQEAVAQTNARFFGDLI